MSQVACRFVEVLLKVTVMVLPPTSRASSWRGWWMSPLRELASDIFESTADW